MKTVLVVGSGGREHALAWKLAQSPQVGKVCVAPGNAGTACEPKVENVAIDADDIAGLVDFAKCLRVDLTVIGPEAPLVSGIVDRFRCNGLPCLGPTQKAAQLEGSKSFAKDFMYRHRIPTARYACFTDLDEARRYLAAHPVPVVLKADGLAAGKGVVLCTDREQALDCVDSMLSGDRFGIAGQRVVIEEFLTGEELSFIALCDGSSIAPLASSQDHKARDDGDRGPNTGGMGACSPAPIMDDALCERIMEEVMWPVVRGMAEEGMPYSGFLYAGLMIGADGAIRVLEFNCRMGDPETQVVLMRLQGDFYAFCHAGATGEGDLSGCQAEWFSGTALGVVLAVEGYPDAPIFGDSVFGLADQVELKSDDTVGIKIFHAGTAMSDGGIVTSGGRVLCVTAIDENFAKARRRAYSVLVDRDGIGQACVEHDPNLKEVYYRGMFYRCDIGWRALRQAGRCQSPEASEAVSGT
ncbi:MAG: phosphoribosylamine--glycine ligase [Candidatus Eutrophobiaceae bacterium]